ncbi:MAG: IS3 family transposase [Blastomonas sp.]|nr:IS3 family transposase [Blastomonas sp.]
MIRQAWNDSGNCRDNAVAETFFSSLKRERIRRRTYKTREEARQDVFDSIEMSPPPLRANGSGVGCCRPSNFNDSGF